MTIQKRRQSPCLLSSLSLFSTSRSWTIPHQVYILTMSDPSPNPNHPDRNPNTDRSHSQAPTPLATVHDLDAPLRLNPHARASSGTGITTLAEQQNLLERLAAYGLDRVEKGRFAEGRVGDVLRAARGDVMVRDFWAEGWVGEIEQVGCRMVLLSLHVGLSSPTPSIPDSYHYPKIDPLLLLISVRQHCSYCTRLTLFCLCPPPVPFSPLPKPPSTPLTLAPHPPSP